MDADQALQELLEVSPQVEAAVIVDRDGTQLASAPAGSQSPLATMSRKLLDAAEQARVELGREPVVQCEVATGSGSVFVVADDTHIVSAVTGSEPTVGLVFYDLKTALRSLRASAASGVSGSTANGSPVHAKSRPVAVTTPDKSGDADAGQGTPGNGEANGKGDN